MTTAENPVLTVRHWAMEHSKKSASPGRFMTEFEEELNAVLCGFDLTELRWDTSNPVRVAAEIEAIAAGRILANWDRRHELTRRGNRYRR